MDRSLAITLGIAVFAHAIAFAVVRPKLRQPAAPVVVDDSHDVIELTSETPIAPSTPVIAAPSPAPTSEAPAPKLAVATKATKAGKDAVAIEVPGPAGASAPADTAAPVASGSEPAKSGVSKIPPLINLDLPGSHAVIWPSGGSDVPLTKEAAAAKKLDAQLKSSLDAHDTATGTGFGGPVVSAAHSAAGGAATLGWATFDVTTDALGSVTMVRVVDFGGAGDSKSWQGVAKDIHANLSKTKLRVPTGAGGVSVRVRVDASMKLPSGSTKGISPSIGAGSVGFDFDVADIGQKPKRIVQVRIVDESRI